MYVEFTHSYEMKEYTIHYRHELNSQIVLFAFVCTHYLCVCLKTNEISTYQFIHFQSSDIILKCFRKLNLGKC